MILAGALLSAVVLSAAASNHADADRALAQSQALMARGAYRAVEDLLEPFAARTDIPTPERARIHLQLAVANSQTGSDQRALAEADRAEADARTIGAVDVLARVESVRGIVWLYRGQPEETLKHLQSSLALAQQSGDRDLIGIASARVAVAYQDRGDCTRALDAINRGLDAPGALSDATRLQLLTRRGLIEAELHEPDAAKADANRAIGLARRIGDRRGEAQADVDLARTCERFDTDPTEGIARAADAVAIASELGVPTLEIGALNQLGSILPKAGHPGLARAYLERARQLIDQYNMHRDEPYVLKNLGVAYSRVGLADQARDVLTRAVARADADNLTRIRWVGRIELARLDEVRDPVRADREFQDSLAILEEQQTNVLLEGFRAGALDEKLAEFDPYDDYINFLLDRGEPAQAFYVAERERARAFLETLSTNRQMLARGVPPGYADAEGKILKSIKSAQAKLRSGVLADPKREELLRQIAADEARLSELRLRLAIDSPALAQARYPKLWRVSDLQSRLLGGDEALLALYLGSSRSVAWIITRQHLRTVVLPPKREIERLAGAAVQQLRDPLSRDGRPVEALSRALKIDALAAAADRTTHLVIVPHLVLYDVPFEALTDGHGRPLVERFAVSYAPSASSLAFLRSLPPPAASNLTLLAVANPVVTEKMARNTRQVDLAHVDLLTPVPESLDEARGIARLFGRKARVLEGAQATRASLAKSGLATARILHFATHGLIDEWQPDRSGLVLTASPPTDDGLLQARDVYRLHLNAQLVTLSACETALGQNVTGEGILGLTRAFFYAGARSVVASLWDVDDAATARFMRSFYANVRRGEAVDLALQHAKLEFLHAGSATSAPFYWAAFVVSGQARAPIESGSSLPGGSIAIAAIIALLLAYAARQWSR